MIVAFSTSSPMVSVAVIAMDGRVLASEQTLAPMRASEACLVLLEKLKPTLDDVEMFAADLGPGSFTGVRVGVTIAKTFAYAQGVKAAGANAFDLIDPAAVVGLPSKKHECFVRVPGREPVRLAERPTGQIVGYGPWFEGEETFPDARRFATLIPTLKPVEPEALVPEYLIEPSITLPKKPYAGGPGA